LFWRAKGDACLMRRLNVQSNSQCHHEQQCPSSHD
jgi:hypothetical protein